MKLFITIPSITLADVYAALTYYHDHREEIRQDIEAGEAFAKQLQGDRPSLIEKITEAYADINLQFATVVGKRGFASSVPQDLRINTMDRERYARGQYPYCHSQALT